MYFTVTVGNIASKLYKNLTFLFTFAGDPEVLARKLPRSIGALADGYKLELP